MAAATDLAALAAADFFSYKARMAKAAMTALDNGASDTAFYETKIATGRYYMARQLPATGMHLARINSGADPVMALDAAAF